MVSPCSVALGKAMIKLYLKLSLIVTVLFVLISCGKQAELLQKVDCKNLIQGCDIGAGLLSFSQIPKPLKPFVITFKNTDSNTKLSLIKAQFDMQNMQMGFNRYQFTQEKTGLWQANVILPVCMQGRADWLMLLELTLENGQIKKLEIPFKSN